MNRGVRGGFMCGVVQSGAMVSDWRIGCRPEAPDLTRRRVRMQDMNLPCSGRTRRRLLGGTLAAAATLALPGLARAAHVVRPWPAARPIPEFALTDLDGKAWSLSS